MQPPPKKSEIIDALTKLRVIQLDEESKRDAAERERMEEEIKPQLVSYAISNLASIVTDINTGHCYGDKKICGVKVLLELEQKDLSADLLAKLRKIHSLPERARTHDFHHIRKEIAMEVNGMMPHDVRVNALLKDEDSRTALEKILETIAV